MQESKKQAEVKRKMHASYAEIDNDREPVCQGCGRGDKPLSHSHTISVADCKGLGKWFLIYFKPNIEIECFYGEMDCHNIWESGSVAKKVKLHNFERKMILLEEHDPRRYNSIVMEMDDEGINEQNYEVVDL